MESKLSIKVCRGCLRPEMLVSLLPLRDDEAQLYAKVTGSSILDGDDTMICTACLSTLKSVHEMIADFKQADEVYNRLMSERFPSEEVYTNSIVNCEAQEESVVVIEPKEPYEVIDLLDDDSSDKKKKKKKKKIDLRCKRCKLVFMSERSKEIHFRSFHKFGCTKCNQGFPSMEKLLYHRKSTHGEDISNATAPRTANNSTITSSSKSVSSVSEPQQMEIPWTELQQCALCNFAALSETLMNEHVRAEHHSDHSTESIVSAIEPSIAVESIENQNLVIQL